MDVKSATTYEKQLEILESRNCQIDNPVFCKSVLQQVNYYRFTAYFLPFRDKAGNYIKGTNFCRVYRIYEFDRKMRQLLFGVIGQVELYLRTQVAYYHAHKYGPLGYMEASNFSEKHDHERFVEIFQEEVKHSKKLLFVKHHIENYEGKFPLWVATELFTFGMLSYFYGDMVTSDKKDLAKSMYSTTYSNLESWLRCCTDLRNICGHHGRLYFRVFSAIPVTPKGFPVDLGRRLFDNVVTLSFLYPDSSRWNYEVLPAIAALIEEYAADIELEHIGFPGDWEKLLKKS